MAIIAQCIEPETIDEADVYATPPPIAQRFPVIPTAWANLIQLADEDVFSSFADRLAFPYARSGALIHEGSHSEPTIGQIWPR